MASLGITARQVVARTGIATNAFDRMRAQGTVDGHITIGQLASVADLLDTPLSDLFLTAEVDSEGPLHEPDPDADTEYLIPVLAGVGKYVTIGRLSQHLHWDYGRVLAAVEGMPARLHRTGFRLVESDSEVAIQPVAGHVSAWLIARLSATSVPL